MGFSAFRNIASGIIEIEVAGNAPALQDRLNVSGAATLAGNLNLIEANYPITGGDVITPMTWASFTAGWVIR